MEQDAAGTLKKVKAMGYDYVELGGFYGMTKEDFKAALDANGLKAVSAHVGIHDMMGGKAQATADDYAYIGLQFMAIPYMPDELRPGRPGFAEAEATIRSFAKLCKEKGITLMYHNHDFEYEVMPDGRFQIDYLYDVIPADILQTQFDTCWVKVAGQDPAAYIRKYAGRCPVVHLKDFFKEGATADMYELLGDEDTKGIKPKGFFEFRPLGSGMQNFPPILEAAVESGAKWVVVEQDSSNDRTSLEAAQMSREYLKSLGW